MPIVGIDNNMYENIIEDIVRSMRSELENFKNQVKAEMMEEMKLWHMIAIEEIRKLRKMEIESIDGDDDRPNQLEVSETFYNVFQTMIFIIFYTL